MPNDGNITSPVTLLGLGRSGTTLISYAFQSHPEFESCGESGGVIFSMWEGAKSTFMPTPKEYWEALKDSDEKCAYFVRQAMKSLSIKEDRPYWFQKPAGLPIWHLNTPALGGERSAVTNFPSEWYWNVFTHSFPDARFVTVIRNPFDVALSRKDHTNWSIEGAIRSATQVYEVVEYGWDKFCSIIVFDDLVSDFKGTIRRICDDTGVVFHTDMLEAANESRAPVQGRGPKKDHRDDWSAFDGVEVGQAEIEVLQRTWKRLGRPLEIPDGLKIV